MTAYARQIETVKRVLAKRGQVGTWSLQTDEDGAKPYLEDETPVPGAATARMIFLPVGLQGWEWLRRAVDTELPRNVTAALMEATPFEPTLGDQVTADGQGTLSLLWAEAFKPDGEVIFWQLRLGSQ